MDEQFGIDVVAEPQQRHVDGLDLTYVSRRLMLAGSCWQHRTDVAAHRNNAADLAAYLRAAHGRNFLVFSFGAPDVAAGSAAFGGQVLAFGSARALAPTLRALLAACRALAAWLSLSADHVAVVQCRTGAGRSALALACFLRYAGLFASASDAHEWVIEQRARPGEQEAAPGPTIRRYLRYFSDVVLLGGRVPHVAPVRLRQLIVNSVPDFDGAGGCDPGVEVFQDGLAVYSQRGTADTRPLPESPSAASVGDATMDDLEASLSDTEPSCAPEEETAEASENSGGDADGPPLCADAALAANNRVNAAPLVVQDANHIVFSFRGLCVRGDVQLRLFHRCAETGAAATILNVAFNTGFVQPGLIRLRAADLELAATSVLLGSAPQNASPCSPLSEQSTASSWVSSLTSFRSSRQASPTSSGTLPVASSPALAAADRRFPPDFSIDLVIEGADDVLGMALSYEQALAPGSTVGLLRLSQFHAVRPEPRLVRALEMQGHRRFFARLSLQLAANDIHAAHEFLSALSARPAYAALDRDLVAFGRAVATGTDVAASDGKAGASLGNPDLAETIRRLSIPAPNVPIDAKPSIAEPCADAVDNVLPFDADNVKAKHPAALALAAALSRSRKPVELRSSVLPESVKEPSINQAPLSAAPPPPPPPPRPLSRQTNGGVPAASANGAPPPPPPMPGRKLAKDTGTVADVTVEPEPQPDRPRTKARLHWEELRQGAAALRGSVWEAVTVHEDVVDRARFEEIFCTDTSVDGNESGASAAAAADAAGTSSPAPSKINVLPLRRVNNVGIALARFYRRLSDTDIIAAIVEHRPAALSVDDMLAVRSALPTLDERASLLAHVNDAESFGAVERFMLSAALRGVALPWMLDALLLERQLDADVDVLAGKLGAVHDVLVRLTDSSALRTLLGVVLALGNMARCEYSGRSRVPAAGFRLSGLLRLADARGADRRTTLLAFAAECVCERAPDALSLPIDFAALGTLRSWDVGALLAHAGELASQYRHAHTPPPDVSASGDDALAVFRERQRPFLSRAAESLERLAAVANDASEAWEHAQRYFCIDIRADADVSRPEQLFGVLDDFLKSLSFAAAKIRDGRRRESVH